MRMTLKSLVLSGLGLAVAASAAGCESKAANGALIGGAAGAGVGAIIGHNSHGRTAGGALIGGAVGAIGGGLIGNEMDKKDKQERESQRSYERRDSYESRQPTGGYTETRTYQDSSGRYYESTREERYYR